MQEVSDGGEAKREERLFAQATITFCFFWGPAHAPKFCVWCGYHPYGDGRRHPENVGAASYQWGGMPEHQFDVGFVPTSVGLVSTQCPFLRVSPFMRIRTVESVGRTIRGGVFE